MIIDDHTLIPHQANWNKRPSFNDEWQDEVAAAQEGKEARASLRAACWTSMRYLLTPFNDIERAKMEAALREAIQSGKACVPWLGKAAFLAEDATGTSFDFESVANLAEGDYLFFAQEARYDFDSWEVSQIDTIVGNTVTVLTSLTGTYANRSPVWPLMFGKITEPTQAMLNNYRGDFDITIQRQV